MTTCLIISTPVYAYRYCDNEIQGKEVNVKEYLSLSDRPGIYYICDSNRVWTVLEVTDYGTYNTLHMAEVPNEVKIYHLLTK